MLNPHLERFAASVASGSVDLSTADRLLLRNLYELSVGSVQMRLLAQQSLQGTLETVKEPEKIMRDGGSRKSCALTLLPRQPFVSHSGV
jgi:hypothetical protein